MSQPCAIKKCNRTSRGLCDCCSQQLCIQYLSEHNASLISQLNPLTDEINELSDRLKTLNIQNVTDDCYKKLEQWREDCYQKIDKLFQRKCQELDELVNNRIKKEKETIERIRSKVTELIREQETTRQEIDLLTTSIRQLQTNINNIEQTCFQIDSHPIIIDKNLINIIERNERVNDLLTLSPVCKIMHDPKGSYSALTSNDRFLLIHQKPNLCLVDRAMNIVKVTRWIYDAVYDMCWSSALNRFIVNEGTNICLADENTMTIDNLQTIEKRSWLSCTCSNEFLFLLSREAHPPVVKFKLSPSVKLDREWKVPDTCAKDERIYSIRHNNEKLSIMIQNITNQSLRIELRCVETLACIWSLQLDSPCNMTIIFNCCALTHDEWLAADFETEHLLQITKDGKLKQKIPYDEVPYNAILFANMLVVSTASGVNFHKV